MRRTLAALVFLSFVASGPSRAEEEEVLRPAVDLPAFWTSEELGRIDEGLEVLNCSRKDLGFQKRPIDDPFRLDVVNKILDEPLAIGAEAAEWDRVVRTGSVNKLFLAATMKSGFRWGGPHPRELPSMKPSEPLARMIGAKEADGILSLTAALHWPALTSSWSSPELLRHALHSQVEKPIADVAAAEIADAEFLRDVAKVDRSTLTGAGSQAITVAERIAGDLLRKEWPVQRETLREVVGDCTVVVYGTGDDVHAADENATLVIDLGGNDTWLRGASASTLDGRPLQICIDLAGNDRYVGENDRSFGSALGGVAIQWDCAGNDVYIAGHASCGAGILGVGILVDEAGDDIYRMKDFGQGAGAYGVGILLDKAGNDLYHTDLFGQGYATTWGCGVLADLAGNDTYDAGGAHVHAPLYRDRYQSLSQGFAIGNRPTASGGVGVLVDVAGNDRYVADIYAQGSSYWYSLGLLIDDDGHDTYVAGQYSIGSGIHLSAGMLLDRAGNDSYHCMNGVGVGGAHDFSVGFLVDRAGDDHYSGSGGSQGGALTNSVAMLIDDAGDDGYLAVRESSQGSATPARGTGGIGLLLDGAGKDVYSESTRNEAVWTKDFVGAGLDTPSPAASGGEPQAASITKEEAEKKVAEEGKDLDSLWKLASAWEVNDNRVIVPIAREKLWALGEPALARAMERLATQDGLEFRAVESTAAKFNEQAVPLLLAKTKDADAAVRKGAVRALTTLAAPEAYDRLVEMLETDEGNRGSVLSAFAALKKAPPAVAKYLHGPKEGVGVQAAVCLGTIGDKDAIDSLVDALGDDTAFPVRMAAMDRLASLGEKARLALVEVIVEGPDGRKARNALLALGRSSSAEGAATIVQSMSDADRGTRISARVAWGYVTNEEVRSRFAAQVALARDKETDPLVKRIPLR